MENKINIAELLKNCPKGMELDCTMFENVTFEEVVTEIDCNGNEDIDIVLLTHYNDGMVDEIILTEFGTYTYDETAKCVIFPKGKTTWEGFHRPFKDGDIIYVCDEYSDATFNYVAIIKQIEKGDKIHCYCFYDFEEDYFNTNDFLYDINNTRFATEEEKQKLFDAIKANGYEWNPDTKILEKLIEPKFKVGDRIKHIPTSTSGIVVKVSDIGYYIDCPKNGGVRYISFTLEKDYELLPNKFDINTLVPFESRVLVRSGDSLSEWKPAIFGIYRNKYNNFYVVGGTCWQCCIPYEENKHLLGTTNDCDEYYKTW